MRLLRVLRQRARSLFRTGKADSELARELQFHLEQLTRENIDSGMSPGAARQAAMRALGGVAQVEEQCRDQRRVSWLTDWSKDLKHACRMLSKSPGFTSLAVLTLAFGLGASISIYSLGEGFLLRFFPFRSPDRLAAIYSTHVKRGELENIGQADFREWQASNTVFERMAFTEFDQKTITGAGEPERLTGTSVSEGFFEMLGVLPQLGRWFTPQEQKPKADRVVILSHPFWMRKLGGNPEVVGRTLFLNDLPYRVTGVMPAAFRFSDGYLPDYWTPISYVNYGHQNHQYSGFARLRPGVTIEAAQSQMTEIARRMEKQFPGCAGWGVRVISLRQSLLVYVGPALLLLGVAALVVLLVACGNVAGLLLARGLGRSKEIAVRMALGAGRRRVVRLLLTESVLVAALGACVGLVFAAWLARLAIAATPPWLMLREIVTVSPTLVAFATALTIATGVAVGLWPALRASRTDLHTDLKENGGALVAGRRHTRSLNSLVVMEIALSVVLLTVSGLLAKSLSRLLQTDLGYRTDRLLTLRMSLPASRYGTPQSRVQFWDKLQPRLAALPGVIAVAAANGVPLGGTYSSQPIEIKGRAAAPDWTDSAVRFSAVTPDYFRTIGIPLRAGRVFRAEDRSDAEPVAIVNESFVRKFLDGGNPLDQYAGSGQQWWRIVGVIGDSHYGGPAQPVEPEAYLAFAQQPWWQFVAIRTAIREESVVSGVRAIVRGLDPTLAIAEVRTMRESVDRATAMQRYLMVLVTGFALLTLVMSTVGLGGVIAYTVSRRMRELGLRVALGASRRDVFRAVVLSGGRLALIGCPLGVLCALPAARALNALLFDVSPQDPVVLVAAPLLLALAALAACVLPARRASSVDPLAVLRQE